jgi:hypothetical protein
VPGSQNLWYLGSVRQDLGWLLRMDVAEALSPKVKPGPGPLPHDQPARNAVGHLGAPALLRAEEYRGMQNGFAFAADRAVI